jgi:molybdopterin-containing oxidoreductase family iron-sulfur binding subunit
MMRLGMTIDTGRCIGCQSCAVACKTHNALPCGTWWNRVVTLGSDEHQVAVGVGAGGGDTGAGAGAGAVGAAGAGGASTGAAGAAGAGAGGASADAAGAGAPDKFGTALQMEFLPVACMMCDNPSCQKVCPTGATFTNEDGIVLVDYDACIGCRTCISACPYGARQFNWRDPRQVKEDTFKNNGSAVGLGASSQPLRSEADTAMLIDAYANTGCPEAHSEQSGGERLVYTQDRPQGVAEKCTFCAQYLAEGELPACVRACPAKARCFGDLSDPGSEVATLARRADAQRLREDFGNEPKIYYINSLIS